MNNDLTINPIKPDTHLDDETINNSLEESIFQEALNCLDKNDVKGFTDKIIELHHILKCDCFFLNKDRETYKNIWDQLESFEDNYDDFYLNYAKYFALKWSFIFVYRRKQKFYRAAKNYGDEVDSVILLNGGLGQYPVKIAEKNIENNNEAKDYYFLARRLGEYCISERMEEMVEKIIESYNKVLELDPTHCCARYQRSMFLLKVCKEFLIENNEDILHKVIPEFNICFHDKISHQQYLSFILELLTTEVKINGKESIPQQYLFYLGYGKKVYLDKKIYSYLLGRRYLNMGKIEDAILLFYSHGRLENFNENEEHYKKNHLYTILKRSLTKAMDKMYHSKNYEMVLELSKCYIFLLGDYSYPPYTLRTYLKLKDETINISIENKLYIYLNDRLDNDIQFYGLSSEFNFGKYKGQTIGQVFDKDPSYLLWCIINVDWFALTQKIFTNNWESLKDFPSIYKALEYLMIKSIIAKEEYIRKQEEYDSVRFDAKENAENAFYFLTGGCQGSFENASPDWWDNIN